MANNQISRHLIIWSVPGISTATIKNFNCGDVIKSKGFEIDLDKSKTKWQIRFYPNSNEEKSKDNVGLYLRLLSPKSEIDDFTVNFTFSFLGKNKVKMHKHSIGAKSSDDMKSKLEHGHPKIVSHEKLMEDAALQLIDRKLTVTCEMTIKYTLKTTPFNFKEMIENEIHTDFQLKMSDEVILKAHKAVLAVRSPVFRRMLETEMKESKDNVAVVEEIDSKTMKYALHWMYTNEVKDFDEVVVKLVYAAEKYELDQLKRICFTNLIENLSVENVLETFKVAEKLTGAKELYDESINFLKNHYYDIAITDAWKQFEHLDLKHKIWHEISSSLFTGNQIYI